MTTKPEASDASPSASTLFLPQLHHTRRASVASLSSIATADRGTLSQALDQINQHASQTESLTTFNEYTSPPLSSSGGEGKGIASELQGGLSGLYNKFRASVGNVRDRVALAGDSGGGDETSVKSPNLIPSSSTSVAWSKGHGVKSSTSSVNPGSSETVDTSGQQSSFGREDEQIPTSNPSQAARPPRLPLGSASNMSFKGSLTPNGPFQSHLPPVAMATTLVSPATAEVNVRAGTEVKSSSSSVSQGVVYSHSISQAEEHLSGTAKKQKIAGLTPELPLSPLLVRDSPEPSPIHSTFSKSDQKSEKPPVSVGRTPLRDEKAARTSTEGAGGTALPDSGTVPEIDYFTPPKNVLEVPKIITHPGSPQIGSADESNDGSHNRGTSGYENAGSYQHLELPAHISQKTTQYYSHLKSSIRTPQPTSTAFSVVSSIGSPTQRSSNSDESEYLVHQRGGSQSSRARIPMKPLPKHMVSRQEFNQAKGKVLNKEYWMKDENARDCFYCGDSFSTFRRKHHCSKFIQLYVFLELKNDRFKLPIGTCGQIFDAKCTSLLPGDQFGYPFSIRVCKPCEGIINGYDDSSEFSDDSNFPTPSLRPRHGSTGASDALGSPGPRSSPGSLHHSRQSPKHADLSAPTMSIPATRKAKGDFSRKPTVLEIEAERTLTRPSSSRSLKSSFPNRPYTPGHRRHNSRHLNQRVYKPVLEDSAPFHRNVDDIHKQNRLPAFHDDNIIDPDLAPYLSDDASSGDEQISIAAAIHGDGIARSFETDKNSFSSFLATSKKGRSRTGDKSTGGLTLANRDTDTHSLSSTRTLNAARSSRRRNLSVVGNLHLRPSPRAHRNSTAVPISNTRLHENFSSSALAQIMSTSAPTTGPRMIRSSSMRGAAAPAIELNSASLDHVRKLLRQLLTDSDVPCVNSWEKALVPILLQATDDVNPDVQNGDDMDLRHYVKFKKILGGRPGDTSYVSGLVFTKNLALKSMPRSIPHPNILILTFPLEYSRHQQHFMSLEPVIRQEREFLQNLVNRIAALHPQLLLVEKNVSGLALGFLEAANIATAYNVKPSVLEAVSRCSQTRIVSSIDKLAIKPPQAGKCASFYLKTYVHGNRKKTYMFLSGCAKELGCTIVLRGADHSSLVKIKRITEFMIYVVYNLKLETCLMRDEFALIPSVTRTGTLSPGLGISMKASPRNEEEPMRSSQTIDEATQKLQSLQSSTNRASADVCNADVLASSKSTFPETAGSNRSANEDGAVPDDVPMPTFYGDMVEEHRTKILSASPFVKFMQPYLLMRAREQERRLAYLRRLRDLDDLESDATKDKLEPQKFELIRPDMVHETIQSASRSVRQVLRAVHDAEYDKALYHYKTQSKQWEAYISANINLFDPRAHQNIAVLYSVVCTVTTIPCAGPDLLALGFYNEHEIAEDFESDCTLGQYVEDLCLGANTVCTANGCEKKMFDHHRQYVHGEAQISVFVEQYSCKLRGLQNTILMWSCCRKCGKETQVMPMSDSTWKYSFGKYLELSFWSKDVHARAGVCPHDLHRDHLRFFGFKDLALRIHYDPITLLEVIVPRARITWKVENDLRFKNDFYVKFEERINKYMASVKARIKSIMIESVVPEKTEACKQEVDRLRERARDEHRVLIHTLQESYMTSQHYETVPFNRAIRVTQEKVTEWDNAFADFDRNFFPSEKDIRRLATLQLKKIFLDRDESNSSLTSSESGNIVEIPEALLTEKPTPDEQPALTPQTRQMSPEKAHHMLSSVVDNDVSRNQNGTNGPDTHQSAPPSAVPFVSSEELQAPLRNIEREDIRHLDLATSSELADKGAIAHVLSTGEPRAIDFASKDCRKDRVGDTITSEGIAALNSEPSDGRKQPTDSQAVETQRQPTVTSRSIHVSGIPRPSVDSGLRRTVLENPPSIHRAHSQPAQQQRELSHDSHKTVSNSESKNPDEVNATSSNTEKPPAHEKRLSERLHLGHFKPIGVSTHSMIPRSIARSKKDSHVSTLAKHFEQLSREFEKERIKERRQRFSRSRQSRVYPMVAAKPIVEVYRNVREAVEEKEPSDEDLPSSELPLEQDESPSTIDNMATTTDSQTPGEGFHAEDTTAENTEAEDNVNPDSHVVSDAEGEGVGSEEDRSLLEEVPGTEEEHHALSPTEAQLDLKLDLPKHEKTSLVKMLTNFWAERSASGWQALDYPLNTSDHIFADSDIIVREDEPSSLIALALDSEDYKTKLKSITSNPEESSKKLKPPIEDPSLTLEEQCAIQRSLHRSTGTHLKYQYQEGSAKMLCKIFYTEQFDAIRRKCGVSTRIVESLSRCLKWDSKGGKTKSLFLKTLDDRFVLKSLSTIETQSFLRFAPAYFQLISECLFQELPSVIAKMLGFYQIIIKNPVTGVDFNWFLIVMENLFYDRSPTRIFDLKGSMRNRRIQSTGEQNEVLLDENMVEFIYESPLFAREHSKKVLRGSVWNDTLFLARQNVMDYSLMIAIDESRKELVVGIIDCIRTYTWDKKLESWIKDRGKNRPTVTSPRDYKNRFREAMSRYVLQAPK
ncbi:MAG: hypothetical protein Q9167_003251 [Letrouitia subvulpina]